MGVSGRCLLPDGEVMMGGIWAPRKPGQSITYVVNWTTGGDNTQVRPAAAPRRAGASPSEPQGAPHRAAARRCVALTLCASVPWLPGVIVAMVACRAAQSCLRW